MEDDEEILSDVKKTSFDEANESKMEEVIANGVEITDVEKCGIASNLDGSNLVGEESAVVEKENVAVLPEAPVVVDKGEAEVEGGGGSGGECVADRGDSREEVAVEEVAAVELKVEVENKVELDNKAEAKGGWGGGGGSECVGDTGDSLEAVVAVELEVEVEAKDEVAAVGDKSSEAVALKEDVLAVEEEEEVARSGGEKSVSDGDDLQADVAEAVITSGGDEKVVEEGGLDDGEKDVSDIGVARLDITESAVVAKGGQMVVAEEEMSVVASTEVGGENAEVEVHELAIVEKDDDTVVAQSMEKETESVVEEATENEESLPPKLEDSQTVGTESAVAIRDDKMNDEMAEVIPEAETKMEMEIDAGPNMSIDTGGEVEHVCESHDFGVVGGEAPVVAKEEKDELQGSAKEENLADNAQMEQENQMDMEALDVVKNEKDEVKGMVEEKGLVQHEKDEVRGMSEEKSSVPENELESEKGTEMDLKESKYGKLVDSQSTSADRNGGDEEAEAKEAKEDIGIEDTGMDAETEKEMENMEITDDGEDEEADPEEEIETEDTRIDEETETEVEQMQITNDGEGEAIVELDGPKTPQDEEDEAMVAEEDTTAVDTEVETETDVAESGKTAGGKRKRGKNKSPANSKVAAKAHKTMEEDVCFICFDGGELVLCDRRGCPKAYHPSCVNRDEAFFRSKGRWNCGVTGDTRTPFAEQYGWHLCSICEKNAHYMCYTCTFSLCKGCIKDAVILCVRGNKGFCETCMRTVTLIENNGQGYKDDQVDFDDKSSWEYLFKDYYIDLKSKLSLSSVELAEAKNPWKGFETSAGKQDKVPAGVREKVSAAEQESPEPPVDTNDDADNSNENVEARKSKRRKVKKRSKTLSEEDNFGDGDNSTPGDTEWASKELLEFVMHMKNGDRSLLSQYDVQALLLEYIKRNNLRDPRQKSRIICDLRLQSLFGKPRVGHFEMLKLLESHFLVKDDCQTDDAQVSVVDTEVDKSEIDGNTDTLTKGVRDRKRKARKKSERRGPQSNLDDYAAIDMHNISLIFLRRKLMEDLLEDIDTFNDKIVGTFVRIRISGSVQKQDLYRLVQVVGTSKAAEPYKVGKKTTNTAVEILNLNKTEVISIDTISNQDFTEEECKRLRQSIRCGLINRLTVGDILDKAMELQTTRVNDWLESEIMRLSHLRDRASEKGRKKELRECVEKLQLLKTPEERQRRLEEIPEIHADPKMDPSYESEEEESEADYNRREVNTKIRGSGSRGGRGPISPGSDFFSKDSWSSGGKYPSKNWDLDRNLSSQNILNKGGNNNIHIGEVVSESPWNQGRDRGAQESSNVEKFGSPVNSETVGWNSHDLSRSESFTAASSVTSPSPLSARVVETTIKINESEKMWHYKDPSGKVQGPFSIVQLRKWSNTGYFPSDLRIWRVTEKEDNSILLTDALAGKFPKESVATASTLSGNPINNVVTSLEQAREGQDGEKLKVDKNHVPGNLLSQMGSPRGQTAPSIELPKISTERWSGNDSTNLPSPTPKTKIAGWTEGDPLTSAASSSQSPAAVLPEYLTHSSIPASVLNSGRTLRAAENNSNNSGTGLSAVLNLEQGGLVVSANTLQNSQSAVTSEPHAVQMHSHVSTAQDMVAPLVQSVNSQNPGVETLGWGSAPAQKVEANSSVPVPGQQHPYSQWGVMPATVQTHAGNFSSSGTTPLPQSDLWRPAQGSQPNMQLPAMPNMPWAVGMTENNTAVPVLRPENSNFGWGVMQGNPNMGWVGAAPLNANINWGATVQGPPSGNSVSGWTMPPGNPGATVQGQVPANANPGWVAGAGNPAVQGLAPGSAHQSWIAPTGNVASTAQGPVPGNVWAPPAGNPGAPVQGPVSGNANQGWGAPAGNQGTWGSEQNHARGKFSGQRDNGSHGRDSGFGSVRPWNRQSSFGNGGQGGSSRHLARHQTPCPYNKNGHCRKGASCDYLHN